MTFVVEQGEMVAGGVSRRERGINELRETSR
jgi:hypothetical protein